jgi:hypothetical protein
MSNTFDMELRHNPEGFDVQRLGRPAPDVRLERGPAFVTSGGGVLGLTATVAIS